MRKLIDLVKSDGSLQSYADTLNIISKQETYVDPGPSWESGNIRIDLVDATGRVGRASYFAEFQENADTIFSEEDTFFLVEFKKDKTSLASEKNKFKEKDAFTNVVKLNLQDQLDSLCH